MKQLKQIHILFRKLFRKHPLAAYLIQRRSPEMGKTGGGGGGGEGGVVDLDGNAELEVTEELLMKAGWQLFSLQPLLFPVRPRVHPHQSGLRFGNNQRDSGRNHQTKHTIVKALGVLHFNQIFINLSLRAEIVFPDLRYKDLNLVCWNWLLPLFAKQYETLQGMVRSWLYDWLQLLHEVIVDSVSLLEGPPDSSSCVRNQHIFHRAFAGQPYRCVQPDVLQHREDTDFLMDPQLRPIIRYHSAI